MDRLLLVISWVNKILLQGLVKREDTVEGTKWRPCNQNQLLNDLQADQEKIITEPDYTEEEEEEYVEPKKRGREPKTHLFTSNIVSTLNDLMGQLSLEEQLIKQQEQNQELKKEELKKIRAMQKSTSKAYLAYA